MNRFPVLCLVLLLPVTMALFAQPENDVWDIDSIFDEPGLPVKEPPDTENAENVLANLLRRRGVIFDAGYDIYGGIAPGWSEAPWFSEVGRDFSLAPGAKMKTSLGLDAQISENFRVKNTFRFEIPNFEIILDEFFFDYNIVDTVFLRGGKYNLAWGISPNYGFTNLLIRVPYGSAGGDSYILKADVPVGIGGLQVLALTRKDIVHGALPDKFEDIGMGGKFNIASYRADVDMGIFYQKNMPLRGFLSIKTTVGNTELYHEWTTAVDFEQPDKASGAVNIGFARDFFAGKLGVNGELFLNAEKDVSWYRPKTDFKEAGSSSFPEGFNCALNLIYRIGGKGNPRLFTQAFYAPLENSAQVVPGIRIDPLPHVEVYFAVPMALGSRDGYYYRNNADTNNRPLSFVLLVSLKGNFRYGFNF